MNTFGRIFRISIFGESHGAMIGVTIDGCPHGIPLKVEDFMDDYSYYNYNDWWDRKEGYYETFSRTYKTKSGESVVAFGYHGQD